MGGECNRVELAPSCLRDRAGARDLMTYSAVRRALGLTAAVENTSTWSKKKNRRV